MSEVNRYRFVDKHGYPALQVVDKVRAERFVDEKEFDAQRLRADTAEAELAQCKARYERLSGTFEKLVAVAHFNKSEAEDRQRSLTAAEQRIAGAYLKLGDLLTDLQGHYPFYAHREYSKIARRPQPKPLGKRSWPYF